MFSMLRSGEFWLTAGWLFVILAVLAFVGVTPATVAGRTRTMIGS